MACSQLSVKLRLEKRIMASESKRKKTRKGPTAQEMGKKGGEARAKALTAEERSAIARKGGQVRQANQREQKAGE
jgi:general stress protein YciG